VIDRVIIIGAVAIGTYVTRIAGFRLGDREMPVAVNRVLAWVPVASFAALATPDIASGTGTLPARVAGAALAGFVVMRIGPLWAGLLAGMVGFWAVQFFIS
jgi:branched-subunit amino acid transport protein